MPKQKSSPQMGRSGERNVLIVGAGAVAGAWTPVTKALEDIYGKRVPVTNIAANAMFSALIWELRWLHQARRTTRNIQNKSALTRNLNATSSRYRRLKERIAARLRTAERRGDIVIRPQLRDLIDQLVPTAHCVLTTNWDTTLESFLQQHYDAYPPVIHLHGTSADASSLYLPSEVAEEPYRHWRTNRKIGALAVKAIRYIENCERLVVYGLSFDPLDAELAVVIAGAVRKRVKKIVVVDIEPEPVAQRLSALTSGRVKIESRPIERRGERVMRVAISEERLTWALAQSSATKATISEVLNDALLFSETWRARSTR